MKEKFKAFFEKIKSITPKSFAKAVKDNYKILLIAVAVIAIMVAAICTIVHIASSSSNSTKTIEAYSNAIIEPNDSSSGFDYTLRCYKTSKDKYIEQNYFSKFINTTAEKSNSESDTTSIESFKACMYNYYEFYYNLYKNDSDLFVDSYYSQMTIQKSAAFGSLYMTKDFMLEIFNANKKTYTDKFKKNFKSENGEDYNPVVSVSNKTKLSNTEKEKYLDTLSDDFDYILKNNKLTRKNIKSVVSYEVKVKSGKKEISHKKYYVAKVKGNWYVIDTMEAIEDLSNPAQ